MSIRGGILIGGRSSRMGSPKQLLKRAGITFAEHLARTLEPYVTAVSFLGSGTLPSALQHYENLHDAPEIQGPMSGILSALRHHKSTWLIVACDLPLLSPFSIEWLLGQRRPEAHILIPRNSQGFLQPHFSLFESESLHPIEDALKRGVYAPKSLANLTCAESPSLPVEVEAELININVPSDLQTIEGLH